MDGLHKMHLFALLRAGFGQLRHTVFPHKVDLICAHSIGLETMNTKSSGPQQSLWVMLDQFPVFARL
jgi:hypothetical protein